jgi:hypothetical protein
MCSKTLTSLEYICSFAARLSHLIALLSWKMKRLLDCVDNRHPTRGSLNDALEWVCGNQNNVHYYDAAMFHGLYILLSSCIDSHLALLHILVRVFSSHIRLLTMKDKRGIKHSRSP